MWFLCNASESGFHTNIYVYVLPEAAIKAHEQLSARVRSLEEDLVLHSLAGLLGLPLSLFF